MGLNGSCCASGGVAAAAAGERMRAVARCQRTHVVGCAAVQVMAQFRVEPLPSPPTERAAGSASSGGGGGGGGVAVERAGSRSVLDAVQDRFPHDDLHLQHTVRPPALSLSICIYTVCPQKSEPLNILQQQPQICYYLNKILHTRRHLLQT